jgi:hypothetical protein
MKKKCDEEVKTLPRRVGNKRKSNGEGVEPLPLLGNERKANGEGVEPSSLLGNERNTTRRWKTLPVALETQKKKRGCWTLAVAR